MNDDYRCKFEWDAEAPHAAVRMMKDEGNVVVEGELGDPLRETFRFRATFPSRNDGLVG
ncbi:hypothetical protein [Streptomyces sp. Ac-502]|uniref:hypothetical protein n=1 Tax=Streptomyces sp. Ac-502 TaxID=3342801 RepID=UPI00386228F7